jgi:hypothetical protein
MLFSLLYLILRRMIGTGRRPQDERDIELLVLRHQVRILQRQVRRPRLHRLDPVPLAGASHAEGHLVLVHSQAADPAPVAPGARGGEVEPQEERPPRSAAN